MSEKRNCKICKHFSGDKCYSMKTCKDYENYHEVEADKFFVKVEIKTLLLDKRMLIAKAEHELATAGQWSCDYTTAIDDISKEIELWAVRYKELLNMEL